MVDVAKRHLSSFKGDNSNKDQHYGYTQSYIYREREENTSGGGRLL